MTRGRLGAVALLLIVVVATGCDQGGADTAVAPTLTQPQQATTYKFSEDWFSGYIPLWEEKLAEFKGRPGVRYLEIGTFEGKSFFWVLDNLLTDPSSRATGIDLFPGEVRQRFDSNLAVSGHAEQVTVIQGYSEVELRKLPLLSFDLIYIDGSHAAKNVLADAVLSWQLLRNNGVMIFDDYGWSWEWPLEFRPKAAVDGFITAFRNDLAVIHRGNQLMIRKQASQMPYVLRIGDYTYSWREHRLHREGARHPSELSEDEREALERLAVSRGFGETAYPDLPEYADDETMQALVRRLGVTLESERSE